MRFISASALWWLLLGAIIILFYLLKLKRSRRVVPSVFLWRRALEEIEANAPFKKLRRNLLLLIQLLALALVVLALARPLITLRAMASGNSIIIIDSTASMSARDEDARSRLDRAKQLAGEMVAGLARDDRAAIIESSSRVQVRSPLTSDPTALASAISDIQETDAAGDLTDAVRLAEQIARTERDANIIIISDGGSAQLATDLGSPRESDESDGSAVSSSRNIGLRFMRVGRRSDNVGIIALNSRQTQAGNREMFASLANFGTSERTLGVELRIDGKLADARTVTVNGNDRAGLVFDALPDAGGLAELRLAVDDDLASDNIAFAWLQDARRIRVGVAAENPFLLQALAVNSNIEARRIAPGSKITDFDCIIAEGAIGQDIIASARSLLAINPTDAAGLWRATGQIEQPQIVTVERSHPLNSFLSYSDLHIESSTRREVAAGLKPIVSSASDGLVWAGDDGRRRIALVGFDLAKSDLPLKVEFPILLSNSIEWLSGRDSLATERSVRAGQPLMISTSAASVSVTTPDGSTTEAEARDGMVAFADTLRVGAYAVKDAPSFAVSLLSQSESDTTPHDEIKTRTGEVTGQGEQFYSERETWRWIAIVALGFLTLEWLIYHRRITI